MNSKLARWGYKGLTLLLCLLICAQCVLAYAEGDAVAPQESQAGTETIAAETPTDAPATNAPTDTPADTATATPTASATDTATPGDATATPDASITPDGSATPAPDATAPVCNIPNCPHVTVGPDGKMIALCPLGEWMLAHGLGTPAPAAGGVMALFSATIPSDIALADGVTTLRRSGTYVLSGGSAKADVVVEGNLAVAILLNGANIRKLSIASGATVQMGFEAANQIGTLAVGSDSSLLTDGTGSLGVGALSASGSALLTMGGGSMAFPSGATSRNGHLQYSFDATGASTAVVDGSAFPFTQPNSDGKAYLWLPQPNAGESYRSSVSAGVLTVLSAPEEPSGASTFDMDGAYELTVAAGASYAIKTSGCVPLDHTLTVNQNNVTLTFNDVDFSTTATVQIQNAARLHISNNVMIKSITASAVLSITGNGALSVGTLTADSLRCVSTVRLRFGTMAGTPFSGWQTLTSPADLDIVTSLSYNGRNYALAYSAADRNTLYTNLPAPDADKKYDLQMNGTEIIVTQIPKGTNALVLGDAGIHITANGSYVITTDGDTTGSVTIDDGLSVSLILRSVRSGGSLTMGTGTSVTAILDGSSRFDSGITHGANGKLTLGGNGALLTSGIAAGAKTTVSIGQYTNVSLTAGSSIGGSSYKPTVINVTDSSTSPVQDTVVTLKIGTRQPIRTTTAANGHVTLWAAKTITKASVVVLSQTNTYADILTGDPANPDALPEISGVTVQSNNSVTYNVTNAQTTGIQYYINRAGVNMPDTYDASANTVPRLFGECNIPNLKNGDVVTFRVYAARQSGQTLSANTADAFQFSEQHTFTVSGVRKTFKLDNQSKRYDLNPFKFASGVIPKGATVTYWKDGKELSSAPTDVGNYEITVVIPVGNTEYIPTTITVPLTIKRRLVLIYPEPSGKIKGQRDPEFFYTYTGVFGSDEVTGTLTREPGEVPGNYRYTTDLLTAPSYYELTIDPESPMFYIDWNPGHYIKVDPLSIINPVHQIIKFSDGMKLDLILSTAEKLNISSVGYSKLVTDSQTHETRPFTPEMRLKHGYDQVMLLLRAEPEINKDGGYTTDADGNILLRGRSLTLSAYHLSTFKRQRITALGFRLDDVMFTLDLADLTDARVTNAMQNAGIPLLGTRYQVTLSPINNLNDLKDYPETVQTDKAMGARMMGVKVELINGSQSLDISNLLPSARTLFDVSNLLAQESETNADISEVTIGRKPGQTEQETDIGTDVMELVQKLMLDKLKQLGTLFQYYADKTETLDSQLVVPYTASETEVLPYTAVMKTSPYLMAKFRKNGLYGLSQTTMP